MSETNIFKEAAKAHAGGANKNLTPEQNLSLQTLYTERAKLQHHMTRLDTDISYYQETIEILTRELDIIENKIQDISQEIIRLENL